MDSYPYRQNPKFVDLLNSQQDIGFGSYEDSVELSSTQVPFLATQGTADSAFDGDTPADSRERRTWTPASKASGKKTVDQEKQVKEFERIWTIKQKEMEAKEHLSKMSLLDSLIGKKEPLPDLVSREWRLGQEHERVERTCTLALFWSRVFVTRLLSFGHENALIFINNQFEDSMDEAFDQYFDHQFDQALENLCNTFGDQTEEKKTRKKGFLSKETVKKVISDYEMIILVTLQLQFFRQKKDGLGRLGLSTLQKCMAAIRVLAYGYALDAVDEYLRLGANTTRLCVENFVEAIIDLFGDQYLRRPTQDDLQRLLHIGELRGVPGMIGSIDCMHWEWKNCPTAWKGQYSRGTLNDINVLDCSHVFDDIINSQAPQVNLYAKYILELEDNLEALQEVAPRLKAVKDDLQKKIEMEERRNLRALDEFNVWLSEVEAIQPKVTKLLEDRTSEIERLSMCGYCSSNFFLTYRYGKDVLETKGY
uniref:Uncharacterized protein n=1 Tax=Brassica oleracea var. oleracea TaxID=109376 RepID=A0A0D3DNM1_BRAOL